MIIQEVYLGQTSEIKEIFEEFKKLRNTYKVWKTGSNSKQTAKIEKLIENLWGFKAFSLSIDPSNTPNAYTYPVANSIDIEPGDLIETTSKGYRYKKGSNVAAISKITKGLFTNTSFSDEEVFAVFLHEIGHSFVHRSPLITAQQEIYKTSVIIAILQEIILGIITVNPILIQQALQTGLYSSNFYKLVKANFMKATKRIPLLREVDIAFDAVLGLFGNTVQNILYFIMTGTGLSYLAGKYSKFEYDNITKKQIEISGHQNAYYRSSERLSDDFANMYGFGPYLSTALIKMENPDNQGSFMAITHSIPVLKTIFNKSDALIIELNGAIGAHPSSPDRIISILNGMETDLKNDKTMPDKVKKELRSNIVEIKKVIQNLKNNEGDISKNKNEYLQALTVLGIKQGSTEDFQEKKFTDRKALEKFYKERKVRKENALQSSIEADIVYECLESFFE